jgi:hypothetical protein
MVSITAAECGTGHPWNLPAFGNDRQSVDGGQDPGQLGLDLGDNPVVYPEGVPANPASSACPFFNFPAGRLQQLIHEVGPPTLYGRHDCVSVVKFLPCLTAT